jgi:hypothetical protein
LNIDLCATVSGPTNGRLDCASGWDGFVFSFQVLRELLHAVIDCDSKCDR